MTGLNERRIQLEAENEKLRAQLAIAVKALRKIDEPKKYHHVEPDDYTQLACSQFVANEARKALGDYPAAVAGMVKLLPDTPTLKDAVDSFVYNYESTYSCQACDNNDAHMVELRKALADAEKAPTND